MMQIDDEIRQKLGSERAEEVQECLGEYFDAVSLVVPVDSEIKLIGVMFKVEVDDEIFYMSREISEGEGKPL